MRKIKNKKNYTLLIISVVIFIVATMILTYYFLQSKDYDDRGTFGDMFGSINALYSGLALAGIIITIIIQRDEMKLQSEEIKNQRFETTLFNLLGLHQQITKDLFSNDHSKNPVKGRNIFKNHYLSYENNLDINISKVFDNEVEDELGHYFRNIYRIIKFIDTSTFSNEKKYQSRYKQVKFLRSQLSAYELVWICYWGMTESGKNLPYYIVKYSLLKDIPKSFKENNKIFQFYKNEAKRKHKFLDNYEFSDDQAFEINKEFIPK